MRRAAAAAFACVAAFAACGTLAWLAPAPDQAVATWVAAHLDGAQRAAWRAASWPGATSAGLALSALGAVACLLAKDRRAALVTALASLASVAAVDQLKSLVGRERPPGHGLDSFAFPSGHAATATVAWGLLALVVVPAVVRSWPRWRLLAPLSLGLWLGIAFGVGVARVLAGVHWPTDVVAGWAWGGAVVAAARLALRPPGPTAAPVPPGPS